MKIKHVRCQKEERENDWKKCMCIDQLQLQFGFGQKTKEVVSENKNSTATNCEQSAINSETSGPTRAMISNTGQQKPNNHHKVAKGGQKE